MLQKYFNYVLLRKLQTKENMYYTLENKKITPCSDVLEWGEWMSKSDINAVKGHNIMVEKLKVHIISKYSHKSQIEEQND